MFNFNILSEQYADNLWVTLQPDETEINALLDEMEQFANLVSCTLTTKKQ